MSIKDVTIMFLSILGTLEVITTVLVSWWTAQAYGDLFHIKQRGWNGDLLELAKISCWKSALRIVFQLMLLVLLLRNLEYVDTSQYLNVFDGIDSFNDLLVLVFGLLTITSQWMAVYTAMREWRFRKKKMRDQESAEKQPHPSNSESHFVG